MFKIHCTLGRNSQWKAFEPGQAVWLKRPKNWKFWRRWIGPFVVLNRTGVNYKLQSGKVIKVAHHNNLKPYFLPIGPGKLTCPDRESEGFEVVQPPHPILLIQHRNSLFTAGKAPSSQANYSSAWSVYQFLTVSSSSLKLYN